MLFVFVITGANEMLARNFTFSHERAAMPQGFFQCGGKQNLLKVGDGSKGGW
jgi:hypothetical protein